MGEEKPRLEYEAKRPWSDLSAEERGERIGHIVHKGAWLALFAFIIWVLIQIAGMFY